MGFISKVIFPVAGVSPPPSPVPRPCTWMCQHSRPRRSRQRLQRASPWRPRASRVAKPPRLFRRSSWRWQAASMLSAKKRGLLQMSPGQERQLP